MHLKKIILKRVCDILISSIGLISLIPLFVIISIIIKLSSKGPVFFVQNRVGKNGNIFSMIKFRSMTIQQDNLSTVSIYGDSRITNFGFFFKEI